MPPFMRFNLSWLSKMKIRATINNRHLSTAEVVGKGHLAAHINLVDKTGSGTPKIDISLRGYDTNDPEETKYLRWRDAVVESRDRISIEVMPDAPADEPSEEKSSFKDKTNIAVSTKQADRILKTAYSCNNQLNELLIHLKNEIPETEYKKMAFAVGSVVNEVFESIARPIYGAHPSKMPEDLRDMPI